MATPHDKMTSPDAAGAAKRPLDIDRVIERVRGAIEPYPKAALFELAERGYSSVFEQLVACVISIRTRDETTLQVAPRLLQRGRTPAQFSMLQAEEIEQLLRGSTFAEPKARQLLEIARRAMHDFGGMIPCDDQVLLSFAGIGPKCANLVLGIACGQNRISVDVHVNRVMNRLGYVRAATPEGTLRELEQKLPERHWVEVNRILVPFGKYVCTGTLPRCSTCPLLDVCRQLGVTRHR